MKTQVGIIGSGPVAQALGSGFMKYGYDVMLGTRDPSKLKEWQASTGGKTGSFADAAAFGEIVVLAVIGTVAATALNMAGPENIKGKLVIEATNPIMNAPPVNGVIQFYTNLGESQMEILQRSYPDVRFVKAFNSVGNAFMVDPDFGGVKPTMFICGNDTAAKKTVTDILDKFGWETEDMGMAEAARAIEPLCMLWCIPGLLHNSWSHAFKLLKQ
jgi:8-hydroxy-5-deazaflavin:NADPH oxidoreductase